MAKASKTPLMAHSCIQDTPVKRILISVFAALLLGASTAWAGPIEDVYAAFKRGDYATGVRILRPNAQRGEAWAQDVLGAMYIEGKGVVQDYTEAMQWFRLAAAQGDASAQDHLGFMYAEGLGVVQDYTEAAKWYRLAATQGYATAQYNLGLRYAKGQGVLQDYVRAHMWFNLAAAKGEAYAKGRDIVARLMTPQQIADAQKLARECQARQFKGCD